MSGAKGIEMPNNNICFTAAAGDPAASFFYDVIVVMLDPNGNLLWTKSIGTYYDDEPYSIAANASNEVFVTGRDQILNREWVSFLLKLDNQGNLLKSRVYDGGTSDGEIMRCILAYDDGSVQLLGDMGTFDERDITLINIDSNAMVQSSRRYKFSPLFTNYPYDFFKASDGGLIFTGDYAPPTTARDGILVKTEADGTLPCFMTTPTITVYNDHFRDTVFPVTPSISVVTSLPYTPYFPAMTIADHIVCALNTGIDTPSHQNNYIKNIFPNPVTDELTIETGLERLLEIQIISIDGRIVYRQKINDYSNRHQIDMKDFGVGVYSVECMFESCTRRTLIFNN